MDIKEQVTQLPKFAALPPDSVEKELSTFLPRSDGAPWIEHVVPAVANRICELVKEASKKLVHRDKEIEAVAAAFLSGVSLLLLGAPGTGKSRLIREVALLCGLGVGAGKNHSGGYFEYLLTNHTMPEELFGGPDLEALAKGLFKRITSRKLPEAEIAFLDEVFRGGSHILNTLLTIINEKHFDSGEGTRHVPLLGLVGASNTTPQDPELEAFLDRFPIRVWVTSIFDSKGRHNQSDDRDAADLLHSSIKNEMNRLATGWNPEQAASDRSTNRISCTNDFRFARVYLLRAMNVALHNSRRFEQFQRLFRSVRERVHLSDRSFAQLWLFAGALDFIRKKDFRQHYPVADGHLDVFRYVSRSLHDVPFLLDRVEQHTRGLQHAGDA